MQLDQVARRVIAGFIRKPAVDAWEEGKHQRAANGQFGSGGATEKVTKVARFREGDTLPSELNGVPFKRFTPPADWSDVSGQIDLDEPEIEVDEDQRASAGLLIEEPDGRVWVVKPKNKFGDYRFTFPKGGVEEGLSPQATAIKEAWEESGLKAKITGLAGDYEGDTSVTRYYTAVREGGQPTDYGEETEGVYLVPKARLKEFLNRSRDRRIAKEHLANDAEFSESDHPRGQPKNAGQFAKKGQVSNSVAVPLHSHGFSIPKGEAGAHYTNSSGHKVSIHTPPEGKKYSSGWTHSNGAQETHGKGGTSLAAHLGKMSTPQAEVYPAKNEPVNPSETLDKLGFTKVSEDKHDTTYESLMGDLHLYSNGDTWSFQSNSTKYSLPTKYNQPGGLKAAVEYVSQPLPSVSERKQKQLDAPGRLPFGPHNPFKESWTEYHNRGIKDKAEYDAWSVKVKATAKLTKEEALAVKTYGKGTYFFAAFNEALRTGELNAEQRKLRDDLKSAVAKSPLPTDRKLLRGVRNINHIFGTKDLSELRVGQVFQDKAPMSTTLDPFTAQRFMSISANKKFTDWDEGLLVIDAPAGTHALPTGAYVGKRAAEEQELLLPPGQKFVVTAIYKVDDPVDMSEVPQVHVRLVDDDQVAKDLAQDAPLDNAQWQEEKHPRAKGGQFAKKGEVSNSVAVPLHSHGFKIAKGEAGAHYNHASGHKVSIHSVPEGKKYSSGWTHDPGVGGGPPTHGQGGTSLALHLKKLLGEPKAKEVAPGEPSSASEPGALSSPVQKVGKPPKPPPSFTNPNPHFQALVETYGLTPVKELTASQFYTGPGGAEVKLGTKPKGHWGSNWHWAVTKPGKQPIKGKNINGLKSTLALAKVKQDWLDAGGVPVSPPAGGGPGEDTQGYVGGDIENLKKYTYGEKVILISQEGPHWVIKKPNWEGSTYLTTVASGKGQEELNAAAVEHGLKAPELKPPGVKGEPSSGYSKILETDAKVWKTPDNGGVAVALPDGPKSGQWALFDQFGKVQAQGTGQTDLNTAFEALHPRGAGGKFIAKPNSADALVEHPDLEFEDILNKAGAKLIEKDGPHSPGGAIYEIPGPEGALTVRAMNNTKPNFGVWKGGISGQSLTHGKHTGADALIDALGDAGVHLSGITVPLAASATPQLPSHLKPPVDTTKLKQVGPQLGSNPGGQYEDETGQKYYVKKTDAEHSRNENLAAKLYQLAGVQTLPYRSSIDPKEVVTEMVPLQANNVSKLSEAQKKQAQQDFAVHAWLANWDAVGMGGDNVGLYNGKPITLDTGGSLAYRAKGGPKGELFGNSVGEWDTLRGSKNPDAQKLYGGMTSAELAASAQKLKAITSTQIGQAVTAAGYTGAEATKMAAKLVARRQDVLNRASLAGKPAAPPPPPEFKAPFTNTHHGEMSQLSAAAPTFAGSEKGSVTTYTGGTYQQINRALRYGYHAGTHAQAENIKNITSWLDKASLPERVVVNRRVSGDYGSFLREMAAGGPGTEWTDFGFASTSTNPGAWSGDVKMVVDMPKGSKAASVKHVSHHSSEDEVLVQRGSRFKLVAFNPKTQTLYCTLDQTHLIKTEAL